MSADAQQWLPIPSYEDTHEVSSQGRVRTRRRRGTKGGLVDGWTAGNGYLMISLRSRNVRRTDYVHRVVAMAFLGPCPDGLEVRHLDGDPTNCRLDNLAYGTHGENILDKRGHGTDHNVVKTHCPQNHPYDDDNTYVLPSRPGARYCRACNRERSQARRAASRSARQPGRAA